MITKPSSRSLVIMAGLLIAGSFIFSVRIALAGPILDGGGFPTATPSETPVPSPTATPTAQAVIITLEAPYPAATETPAGFDPGAPSNIQEAGQPTPTPAPAGSGRNALFTAAYIGLFIFLVVGVWMLFSRRGMNQGP